MFLIYKKYNYYNKKYTNFNNIKRKCKMNNNYIVLYKKNYITSIINCNE